MRTNRRNFLKACGGLVAVFSIPFLDANAQVFRNRRRPVIVDRKLFDDIYPEGRGMERESVDNEEDVPYFSIKGEAEISHMEVGLRGKAESEAFYLFSDGEIHEDFEGPYFSYNRQEKTVAIGVPEGHPGIYINFHQGNNIIDIEGNKLFTVKTYGTNYDGDDEKRFSVRSNVSVEYKDGESPFVRIMGAGMAISGDKVVFNNPLLERPRQGTMTDLKGRYDYVSACVRFLNSKGNAVIYQGRYFGDVCIDDYGGIKKVPFGK